MKRFPALLFMGSCAFLGSALAITLLSRFSTLAVAQSQSGANGLYDSPVGKMSNRFELVTRKVAPAVVYVEATKPTQTATSGRAKKRAIEESGSGVIIEVAGWTGLFVLTNNHVISKAKPHEITITLADGRLFKPRRVLADTESDIALLVLGSVGKLPTAALADSDKANVGQWVLAMGSPFGLNQSITHGIISAKERGQVSLGATIRIKDFLQTDAAINPGSSGGPLVNLQGEVVGINTAIASNSGSNSGIAFSIPANLVKRVIRQLLDKGYVTRGYLGMQLAQTLEPSDALKLGMDRVRGALVEAVYQQTPAADAGLQVDDVILKADNIPIRSENHLINLISSLTPGQRLRLQVWRARKTISLHAVVGDWSKERERFRRGG